MDPYLILYDFRQKVEDCLRLRPGALIGPSRYAADVTCLVDFIAAQEQEGERLRRQVADQQAALDDKDCHCTTGDYDAGYEDGREEGYRTGREEGEQEALQRVREALGM